MSSVNRVLERRRKANTTASSQGETTGMNES